ncbi:MAG TPA: nuclease-related domain-containing protein [Chthoniobacterales bacterium]|nr:nuclease-related domain-containing protein [Chthoniobacterales bacterium]
MAGQSLREEIERRFDDFVPYLMIVFAFWMVCLVEWTQQIAGEHPGPKFWMFLSALVTLYGGFRAFRLYPQLRNLRFGEQGERRVAEILDRLRSKGFIVFHDLVGKDFNIDHVVVGPSGIYAIETKNRSGSGAIEYPSDDELIFGGRIKDGWPLRQARGAAWTVHDELKTHSQEYRYVKPLVVFVGNWRVHRHAGDFAADVITANQLENYFDWQQPELTRGEIARISSHLEHFART